MNQQPQQPRTAPSIESAMVTLGVLALVIILLAGLRAFPTTTRTFVATDGTGPAGDALAVDGGSAGVDGIDGAVGVPGQQTGGGGGGGGGGETDAGGGGGGGGRNATCRGGATDVGVSATEIKLGSTVVDSGIGSSFLGPVRLGMLAVQQKVNRAGGICGRKLKLIMKDDGWDRQLGRQFIQNLVEDEKVFALAVVPSSEGLDNAAAYLDGKGVPVVGTDGMLASQYTHAWTWPVATSTLSIMHAIAKEAHDRGARQFSLVFDRKYKFGIEGAYAFNEAVKRLTGSGIPGYNDPFANPKCEKRFCGIPAGSSSYNAEARVLSDGCQAIDGRPPCDFNALLVEPTEGLTWFNSGGTRPEAFVAGGFGAAAAQPLFTRKFAEECQRVCDKLVVWTSFNPPIERFASLPGVQQYVNDVKAQSATADVNNQFLEGGYLGMILLVQALEQVGGDLTRARLRTVLDSITLDTGLTKPLSFKQTKFANRWAQGFRINNTGSFGGWTEATKDWVEDPWVGQDLPR